MAAQEFAGQTDEHVRWNARALLIVWLAASVFTGSLLGFLLLIAFLARVPAFARFRELARRRRLRGDAATRSG